MNKKANSSEQSRNQNEKHSAFPGWKQIITTISLALATRWLSSCDKIPNNEIKLSPADQSAKFSITYQFSEWSAGYNIVDYDITIHKEWDTYMWLIEQNGDYVQKTVNVASDNIDKVFEEVSNASDSEQITDNTRADKDEKIQFVKDAYKKYVLDAKDWKNSDPITLKYKKKK